MRKLILLVVFISVYLTACVNSKKEVSNYDVAIDTYYTFLRGEVPAVSKWNGGLLFLEDFNLSYHIMDAGAEYYALYDFTGSGIPELLIAFWETGGEAAIFSFDSGELLYINRLYKYEIILVNGAKLRYKTSTGHMYEYDDGETKVEFTWNGSADNPLFIFEDEFVTKEEWDELTEPLLSIPHADITWHSIDDIY